MTKRHNARSSTPPQTSQQITRRSERYEFLVDTYETEILKVLSVWSMFDDDDLPLRPHVIDKRGRSVREQMVHQCVSEDLWFSTMLGIRVTDNPLPANETRLEFIKCYAENAQKRIEALRTKSDAWWEEVTDFFGARRSCAWIITRRMTHTSHHRGQQTAMLRVINHDLHSTYGPTTDTGGLMQNNAPVIYAYSNLHDLLEEESNERRKTPLPGPGTLPPTERPDS